MASSVVDLINNSLSLVGADFITSIDQNTRAAVVSKQVYPGVRDATLRAFTWNCAEKAVILAPLATPPAFVWAYAFQMPSDCLRIIQIEGEPEYKVQGRTILVNQDAIQLTYVFRQEDVTQYDALLSSCMEARLAAELAFSLLESKSLRDDMWGLYTIKLKEAKGVDSRERSIQTFDTDIWLASRQANASRFRNDR